ncbi:MAG: PASTA domain-containing protein [Pseudonocardiaceae bacterium]
MSAPWKITPSVERVDLGEQRTGKVTFTVSNPGPVDDRAVLDIVCSENAQRSWFDVGEPQRLVPHGGSVTFAVAVRPGDEAANGSYWLAGCVYSADTAPEESSVISERVTFEIAAGAEPRPRPWWLWAIPAGVLVLAVIGVVLFLVLRDGEPDTVAVPGVTGESVEVANQRLRQAGLAILLVTASSETSPVGNVIAQDPEADTPVARGSDVTVTVSLGKKPAPTATVGPQPPQTLGPLPPKVENFCLRFPGACERLTRRSG